MFVYILYLDSHKGARLRTGLSDDRLLIVIVLSTQHSLQLVHFRLHTHRDLDNDLTNFQPKIQPLI